MTSNEKKYLNSELQKLKRAVKKVAQQEGDVVPNNSTMSLTKAVTQTTHGFIVGNTIRHNGTKWVKSQANNKANAKTVGVVSLVTDANTFSYAFGGFVAGTYVNGTSYFLSPTTAGLIVTEPTYTDGQVGEFIGTGTPDGLLLELDLGDVVGSDTLVLPNKKVIKYTSETSLPVTGDFNTVYFLAVAGAKYLKYWNGLTYLNTTKITDFFRDYYAKKSDIILVDYTGTSRDIAVIEDEDNSNTFTHYFYTGSELQWMVSVNQ